MKTIYIDIMDRIFNRKVMVILLGILILLLSMVQVFEFRKFIFDLISFPRISFQIGDILTLAGKGLGLLTLILGIFNIICSLFLIIRQKLPSGLMKILFIISLGVSIYLLAPLVIFDFLIRLSCPSGCGSL